MARIYEAMRDKGMNPTQEEIARISGVSQPTVHEWQEPGRGPALKNAERLAKRLNVCVHWLYTGEGGMRPIPRQDAYLQKLLLVWDHLSDDEKGKLLGFAEVSAKGAPFAEPSPESLPSSRAAF